MFRSHTSTSFSQTLMSVGKERISVTSMQNVLTHLGATNATAQLGIEGVDSFVVSEGNKNFYCSITSALCSLSDCTDGELLLYDGVSLSTNHSNGTVLVCLDNEYGTVCDDWWDPLDATVVCSQLGFSANGMCERLLV